MGAPQTTGWAPTGAQLALELAQNPLTDDESFLQWVERYANRYIEAARERGWRQGYDEANKERRDVALASGMTKPTKLESTEERRRFIYRHIQFNHSLRTPGQLLEEHGDSRWELISIVPYDGYDCVLVLRSEE